MENRRHAELIAELETAASSAWGPRALLACLRRLRAGDFPEAKGVVVHDAVATTDEFRVLYSSPWNPRVGIIRNRNTTIDRLDVYATGDEATPEEFGQEVADLNICEPLGSYSRILELDSQGIGWWGHLPLPPSR